MASSKTKHAISQLTDALRGGDAISLEILYARCDGDLAAIAGALSSLIEKEEIQIGRNRPGADWLISNKNLTIPGAGIIWYNRKKQMRKVLPRLLKAIKKYLPEEPEPPENAGEDEDLAAVRNLLSDGQPRSQDEIIGITGLEDLAPLFWRHFPKLPDGRFTLPNSSGAWEYLLQYLNEKPRRLSNLLRLFRRHDRIIEALTAEKLQAPLMRLPHSFITTITSPAGQAELTRQEKLKRSVEKIEALPKPFFTLEDTGLTGKEFLSLADKYALAVNFDGHSYWCLRREFPGDILVEQLGEISGRYFAPPFAASAPRFLRENSLGEKEAAAFLGIDEEILAIIIKEKHLGSFVLDDRIRLWHSDVQELKRDPGRLHELTTRHRKLSIPQAAAMLGISTGQVRQLINSGKLTAMPGKDNDNSSAAWLLQRELEDLGPNLSAYLPGMNDKKAKAGKRDTPVTRTRKKTPRRVPLRPPVEELVLDDFQIEAAEALKEGLSVIVSAPTGNGKTLVAEMLARNVMAAGLGMIYTSPLKALSNQKFRDFKELFGKNQVGLVTGDVSINPGAPMLIMTTEIFRNWCLSEPAQLEKISYVVFDEIHYLDDMERGTTWEESILFAPSHIKILGLSATVPNADEMADWISSVRGGDVVVILEKKRRVPLSTQWILPDGKIVDEKEAQQEIDELIEYNKALRHKKRWSGE
ncbi:MAG: DEAD/DEAH box helicase [Pelotomaculum sp.]